MGCFFFTSLDQKPCFTVLNMGFVIFLFGYSLQFGVLCFYGFQLDFLTGYGNLHGKRLTILIKHKNFKSFEYVTSYYILFKIA